MSDQVMVEPQENENTPEAAESSEQPVGEVLRHAREVRGLKVDDIAQTLKLGYRQVEALEAGNWNGLPGQTFIRGFVRNYARLVGLDPGSLMDQLDRVLERPADNLAMHGGAPASMPATGRRVSRRDRSVVLFGIAAVVAAMLAYFLLAGDLSAWRGSLQSLVDSFARKDEAVTAAVPQPVVTPAANEPVFPPGATQQQVMYPQVLAPAESGTAAPGQSLPGTAVQPVQSAAEGAAASAPQLLFRIDKESWVEVRDRDNKVVFSQRMAAGSEQIVSGQGPLSLNIGYAPGVRLYWRGQAVDLLPHTRGDVARLVLE